MYFDPFNLLVSGSGDQFVWATDDCAGGDADITDYFLNGIHSWSTGNTQIATASNNLISAIAIGSTTNYASGYMPITREIGYGRPCPNSPRQPSSTVKVNPRIIFGGQDITNTTQSVVVGQQIALNSSYTLPSGVTVTSQSWSVAGTTVGGYTPSPGSPTSGVTIPTNFSQGSTTFYWTAAGSSLNVTFTLNLSDGTSPTASATFNVAGPSAATVTTLLGTINISNNKLVFGGSGTNIGIKFTASATAPSGYSNTFVWVQLISSRTVTLTGQNSHTCNDGGLDGVYPYPPITSTSTNDNPGVGLSTSYSEESYNMSAQMYLMWSSGLANSIPVPVGSVNWQWFGDAVYSTTSGTWSVQPSSSASANSFQTSSAYPQWTTLVNSPVQCP